MNHILSTPEDVLHEWIILVKNGDIEKLLALYSENAVLIPTFSNRILSSPEAMREYFTRLCSREKLNIALHKKAPIARLIQDKIYFLCGVYCWRFAIDEELFNFEAHFSYTMNLTLSRPILHHHSSQIPRML